MSRYVYTGLFSRVPHRTVNSRKMKMMAVDDQRRRGVTDTAGAVVALENPFPLAAEAGAGAAAAIVAELAQPATTEVGFAAGAAACGATGKSAAWSSTGIDCDNAPTFNWPERNHAISRD